MRIFLFLFCILTANLCFADTIHTRSVMAKYGYDIKYEHNLTVVSKSYLVSYKNGKEVYRKNITVFNLKKISISTLGKITILK